MKLEMKRTMRKKTDVAIILFVPVLIFSVALVAIAFERDAMQAEY